MDNKTRIDLEQILVDFSNQLNAFQQLPSNDEFQEKVKKTRVSLDPHSEIYLVVPVDGIGLFHFMKYCGRQNRQIFETVQLVGIYAFHFSMPSLTLEERRKIVLEVNKDIIENIIVISHK